MKTFFTWLVMGCACACGGQTLGGDAGLDASPDSPIVTGNDGGSGTCTANTDCPKGFVCGFDEAQGCAAKTGQCFQGGAICNTFQPGCACNGQTINVACTGLPSGYATAPLAHTGSCDTPIVDAGAPYACGNATCTIGQELCYIPANDPSGGTCMPLYDGCASCPCAQAQFQCVSSCKQTGPEIYVECQ